MPNVPGPFPGENQPPQVMGAQPSSANLLMAAAEMHRMGRFVPPTPDQSSMKPKAKPSIRMIRGGRK